MSEIINDSNVNTASSSENVISINNVTKQFKVFYDKGTSLKEKMLFWKRNRYENRVVLNDISLDIKRGEAVGLIGHNGCGKSTLLKLMTRILYPESGSVNVKGRVSSLIELGAGFHPDMSGRENIYTNASIFGLSKKEIDSRVDKIIRFSELEDFIDNPVRTYSSGMYMRLAFAVAINVNADVLLIDEILAVGDANFQAKCFSKLQEIKASGTTIVIVSHTLSQIEEFCDRSVWIHEGKIKADGSPREIHPMYLDYMAMKRNEQQLKDAKENSDNVDIPEELLHLLDKMEEESAMPNIIYKDGKRNRWGSFKVTIEDAKAYDSNGNENYVYKIGDSFVIRANYKVKEPVKDVVFGFGVFRADGLNVYGTNTHLEYFDKFDLTEDGVLELKINSIDLIPGDYTFDLTIETDINAPVDYRRDMFKITTYADYKDIGVTRIDHEFCLDSKIKTYK